MNKTNYIVDMLMTLFFIFSAISGLAIFFFMPSGVPQGRFQVFLGIEKQYWTLIHNWTSIILIILVIVHFVLHWNWIVCTTRKMLKR